MSQQFRVLLVDDVEEVRYSIASTLTRSGFQVIEAEDGLEALSVLGTETFDAIVTDLWMPKLDGVELIRTLRGVDDRAVIVAISGGAPKAPINFSVALAETWGADAVFVKPFDNDDLADRLHLLLDH